MTTRASSAERKPHFLLSWSYCMFSSSTLPPFLRATPLNHSLEDPFFMFSRAIKSCSSWVIGHSRSISLKKLLWNGQYIGVESGPPRIKRELQNHGFPAEGTVYTNLLQNPVTKEHLFTPPYTPCWQRAEVIATTGKVLLRDTVWALQKNYTKPTLRGPEFLPPSAIT